MANHSSDHEHVPACIDPSLLTQHPPLPSLNDHDDGWLFLDSSSELPALDGDGLPYPSYFDALPPKSYSVIHASMSDRRTRLPVVSDSKPSNHVLDSWTIVACTALQQRMDGQRPSEHQLRCLSLAFDVAPEAVENWFQNLTVSNAASGSQVVRVKDSKRDVHSPSHNSRNKRKHQNADPCAAAPNKDRPFPCTSRCGCENFADKAGWKRHEELHFSQKFWLCPSQVCQAGRNKGKFPRKYRMESHLSKFHSRDQRPVSEYERITQSNFEKSCIFHDCNELFHTWKERIDHLGDHFSIPWDNSQWTTAKVAQSDAESEAETSDEKRRKLDKSACEDTSDDRDSSDEDDDDKIVPNTGAQSQGNRTGSNRSKSKLEHTGIRGDSSGVNAPHLSTKPNRGSYLSTQCPKKLSILSLSGPEKGFRPRFDTQSKPRVRNEVSQTGAHGDLNMEPLSQDPSSENSQSILLENLNTLSLDIGTIPGKSKNLRQIIPDNSEDSNFTKVKRTSAEVDADSLQNHDSMSEARPAGETRAQQKKTRESEGPEEETVRPSNASPQPDDKPATSRESIRALMQSAWKNPKKLVEPENYQTLERAAIALQERIQANPGTYVMEHDEFSLLSFFPDRFNGNRTFKEAEDRFWNTRRPLKGNRP